MLSYALICLANKFLQRAEAEGSLWSVNAPEDSMTAPGLLLPAVHQASRA